MSRFDKVPSEALRQPIPFTLRVSQGEIDEFKTLLALSKVGPQTWENSQNNLGLSREWLLRAKDIWLNKFQWRAHEDRINSFPNFQTTVEDPIHGELSIHFVGLFSADPNAIPIMFLHGWPGSFFEFLPMLELLKAKYTPESLPYHVIVPSLPGYTLSSGPPLERDFNNEDAARIMNQLMVDLGFAKTGYIVQGGDVGSFLARKMVTQFEGCKAIHLNLILLSPEDSSSNIGDLPEDEAASIQRQKTFWETSYGYGMINANQPATISFVMSSNPLALLAWIGEKFVQWADAREPLELDTILAMVSLYWFTSTFPRSVYPYRCFNWDQDLSGSGMDRKPFGYSAFARETSILPKAWAEKLYPNMIRYEHRKGGHFAALEQPQLFLGDIEDFIINVGYLFEAGDDN
ncbi:hypothetical protein NM208_g5823 [Fusarium decemcellulare]|uniref:Uncharacterized protein n=2 Tax=Fusarium decemcellulare TaxID=57161 RepID=A0ACC1SFK7_9HYPO|nr:hypothetical protein NM208_g6832 [Fusarium decemcellulare]KAJ3538626.1 hypothetical protein NM208_g5823 [Fusarium decemcellulare]